MNKQYQDRKVRDCNTACYTHVTSALLLPSIHDMHTDTHTLNIQNQIQMKVTNQETQKQFQALLQKKNNRYFITKTQQQGSSIRKNYVYIFILNLQVRKN